MRLVLKNLLEQHVDWKVCAEAENGSVAIAKAKANKLDLIVLDFGMPVMNGLEAARAILKILPTVPIVLFTVHVVSTVKQEAQRAGVRQVLDKADYGAMVSAIETLVGRVEQSFELNPRR